MWRRWWRGLRPLGDSPSAHAAWVTLRRVMVATVGLLVVLAGLVMLVTPGPALLVIPLGLFLLGFEYAWALRLQKRVTRHAGDAAASAKRRWWGQPEERAPRD